MERRAAKAWRGRRLMSLCVGASLAGALCAGCSGPASDSPAPGSIAADPQALSGPANALRLRDADDVHRRAFNHPGNVLISDQYNNRVIEVTPEGSIVWQFGAGPDDLASGRSPVGVNDAQRVGLLTLVAATGNPGGFGACQPGPCRDNRVMLVDRDENVVWQYGQFGVKGSDQNQLDTPVQATWLPTGHVLITDQANARVIEVDQGKDIVWQYGVTHGCTPADSRADNCLNDPNSAELLANGDVLIADEGNARVIEVNRDHHIVGTFTANETVGAVAFASRLENGNTLITDAGKARAVEVDRGDNVVWQCVTNLEPKSTPSPQPSRAVRLKNGNTVISDQYNNRVIIVNHDMPCQIVASFGLALAMGANTGYGAQDTGQGLNGPYDAKVIGDFTGLTPPERVLSP